MTSNKSWSISFDIEFNGGGSSSKDGFVFYLAQSPVRASDFNEMNDPSLSFFQQIPLKRGFFLLWLWDGANKLRFGYQDRGFDD